MCNEYDKDQERYEGVEPMDFCCFFCCCLRLLVVIMVAAQHNEQIRVVVVALKLSSLWKFNPTCNGCPWWYIIFPYYWSLCAELVISRVVPHSLGAHHSLFWPPVTGGQKSEWCVPKLVVDQTDNLWIILGALPLIWRRSDEIHRKVDNIHVVVYKWIVTL